MRRPIVWAFVALLAAAGQAQAACYEFIGCTDSGNFQRWQLEQLSCQALWEVRNTIYYENGLCFQTSRAINFFGNDGCWVRNQSQVRLNNFERNNAALIRQVETARGC